MEGRSTFQDTLKIHMHAYAKEVYRVTKKFPVDERFGMTSQLRRAALSVPLNYIEGYARFKKKVKLNFFEISYGSLKESNYLLFFAESEQYISKDEYTELIILGDEIGKMLWTIMKPLRI